ncbi:tyrosine-type recombinase/integrase [Thermodesulfobacteriota bacterium]
MADKIDTTHTLMERRLILYRRERSSVWQCRFKVGGIWQRKSTNEQDIKAAEQVAHRLLIEAEIRKKSNLPVVTRRFKDVAKLTIKRLETDMSSGNGKAIYKDYIRVIRDYLIPILGKRNIDKIDHTALDDLDAQRIVMMEKKPSQSTLLTQNAALNRVFDEAQMRGLITNAIRPTLSVAGRKSERRPDFSLEEVFAIYARFDDWVEKARAEKSKELRALLRDYVHVMLDTGARPGNELLDLKWKQITYSHHPSAGTRTGIIDETEDGGEEIVTSELNPNVLMVVSGKTGRREILGAKRTVRALQRIAIRNYGIAKSISKPLANLTNKSNDDYVFRISNQHEPTSFPRLFATFLREHNLLIDPNTEQQRVFYSLRHTYATLALIHDKVPIHTLAKQMGTSVGMIEKHYSHLKVIQAKEQLRGSEREKMLRAGSLLDTDYAYKGK